MTNNIQIFLAAIEPFKHLSVAGRLRLAQAAEEMQYAKGETLFREGELCDAVWVVKTGRIHLMRFLAEGKVITTCVMTPGELFCCLPAMDRKGYPVDAVAAEKSTVIRIALETFHGVMADAPAFLKQTLCLFCDRLRQVEQESCRRYDPVETRLAQVLLTLSKKFGPTIPLTRNELAEIVGTTTETVIRVLSRLKTKGIIRSSRGKTTILKKDGLSIFLDNPRNPPLAGGHNTAVFAEENETS